MGSGDHAEPYTLTICLGRSDSLQRPIPPLLVRFTPCKLPRLLFLVNTHKHMRCSMKRGYSRHGMTNTKIHNVWKEMLRRCKDNNPRSKSYKDKGISVCSNWRNASCFISWALSNGYRTGLQLDRIDNTKGYSPENCRFVTAQQNANNRDNNIHLSFNGKTQTLGEWSRETGIKHHTLYTRFRRGWDTNRILTKIPGGAV